MKDDTQVYLKWLVAFLFGIFFTIICSIYVYHLDGSILSLPSLGKILAGVSALLFAVSLGAGGLSHYTGFPNMGLGYQKYIGIMAFWVAFAYSGSLLFINPDFYFYNLFPNLLTADVSLGLIAMFIFGLMVIAPTPKIFMIIGEGAVHFILGLGFVAYALLVIRAVLIEWDIWVLWYETLNGLPPTRIILSIIATLIIAFRASIPIHKKFKSKQV